MVDTKKEQERDELHRAIWAIADELRGAVDGWDFKNFIVGSMVINSPFVPGLSSIEWIHDISGRKEEREIFHLIFYDVRVRIGEYNLL